MDPEESTPEDLDAYFVSFREVKTGPCHRYYLIRGDSRGGQTLGAVGTPSSSGAASGAQPAYDYRNARNFTNHGTLATQSKRELMTWLDGVVAEGIARQAVETGGGAPAESGRANDDDGGPVGGQGGGSGVNPSSPRGSEWINFSQDKFSFPDGRRGIRFYLVDAQGGATAAVLGEERDTRDGHYVYRKDDDFTAGPPLNCGNLTGVHRWLRDMCAGGAGVLLGTAGGHVPKRGGAKGGGAGRGVGASGGNRNDREHPLDVLGKRRAPSEHHRSSHTGDEDTIATRRLRVEEREVRWLTARRAALAFVREEIHPHTQSEITKVAKALAEHVADSEEAHFPGGTNKTKGKKAKERAENALARVVEALRSLSSQYVSLKVMDGTNIVPTVASLRTHPHPTVAKMAEGLCTQWLGSVHNAVGTLAASYERPPPPPPPQLNPPGANGGKKPKPVYDEAFLAAMRNEPQLRRTRQKEAAAAAAANPGAGGGSGGGGVGSGGGPGGGGDAKPPPAAGTKAEPKAAAAKAAVAKPQHKSPPKHAAKVSPPAAAAAAAASAGAGGKKKSGSPVFAPHNPGTPLGKGRKLCLECNGVVGSPTRVCPHCNATLPFKQHTANSPKGAAAKNAAAAAKRRASAEGDGGGGVGGGAGGVGGGGGGVGASSSVAQFLGRHRERFVSCKVSQLRRNVQEVCEGVRAVLDAGRVQDPGAAKHLREMSKKVGEVRLLQGVVERPRARKEVMGLIEAAVKVCNRHGV